MDPSEKISGGRIERPLSKRERLQNILELLKSAAPVASAAEAHKMVADAFKKIESGVMHSMIVIPFKSMSTVNFGERKAYYNLYSRHVLMLGENGAIEMRTSDVPAAPADVRPTPYGDLELAFEKPGADGKKLWE